ncbi:tRNA modification GTPase MnmE [Polystyrenella longa]|uniref:tRNA modification GTPase MnmE n=1 Tax=Polystyrenella longa TaxID=2528007 RepID=A0A518CGH5_9PLAN|nr:GTPase [Polystyrenella longa]QDU78317.1 tRNA modification GTPase MnmE [Polystyrenella longa]
MNQPTSSTPMATLLTPRGRGAVATIACRNGMSLLDDYAATLFRPVNGKPMSKQKIDQVLFGHWGELAPEEVVVCRTNAEEVEIHCHGGHAAVERVLGDLTNAGFTVVPWQEFQSATMSPFEAELNSALAQARTTKTASLLLQQRENLPREIDAILAEIKLLEAGTSSDSQAVLARLQKLRDSYDLGRHLTEPFQVVLAGRPNVGKSSLINALVGYERAIVFDQPGTTRDAVRTETAFGGWPVELTDTAGLRLTDDQLESAGIARARAALQQADLGLLLFDSTQPLSDEDRDLINTQESKIIIAHKSDLSEPAEELASYNPIRVSSVTGEGLEELMTRVQETLVPVEPGDGDCLVFTERQRRMLETVCENGNTVALADRVKLMATFSKS